MLQMRDVSRVRDRTLARILVWPEVSIMNRSPITGDASENDGSGESAHENHTLG